MSKFKSIVVVYWLLVIIGIAGGFLILTGWSYPITHVSVPKAECKSVRRENMPDGCVIDIPKIKGGNSDLYKNDPLYPLIYSDLWGGSYNDGRSTNNGSNPGIDIVSSKGTPVYSINDGTVVQVGYKFGIGNSITIKHLYQGSYIYSSYSHLDEMYVQLGDHVSEGKMIGRVGNTGTTFGQYGNHLDFQLTTTTQSFYPYSYWDCNVGLSYYDIVNSVMCRSYMIANTMDPIAFLESKGTVNSYSDTRVSPLDPIVQSDLKASANTHNVATIDVQKPGLISSTLIETDQISESVSPLNNELIRQIVNHDLFQYQISGLNPQETVQVKRKFVFFIDIYDLTRQQLHQGILHNHLVIRDAKGIIAFDSPVIGYTADGNIMVTALGLKKGFTTLSIEIAGQKLASYDITLE